jgi:squalene cyclase
MTTQIIELEQKIQQLFDEGKLRDIRTVFDIGVEFGSALQRNNVTTYDYVFWSELDKQNKKETEIRDAVSSINKFLLMLVRKSIAEYIDENASWSISKGNWRSEYDEFDTKTLRKYCVQITYVNMSQYGGDFECRFKVVGKLAKLFKKNNIHTEFEVLVYNDNGEEETSIYEVSDINSAVARLNCHVRNINNWEVEQYKQFLNEISKDFLFDILKAV